MWHALFSLCGACTDCVWCGALRYGTSRFISVNTAGSSGDPHLVFHGGGTADFRGEDNRTFAFLTAPDIQVNIVTQMRSFARWNMQVVHGSFVTRLFLKARLTSGSLVRAAVYAEEWDRFRLYESDDASRYDPRVWVSRCNPLIDPLRCNALPDQPGIAVTQTRIGKVVFRCAGWEVTVRRRKLRMPLIDKCNLGPGIEPKLKAEVCAAPMDDRTRFFLDLSFRTLDNDPDLASRFGNSTIGHIAPQ